MTGNTLDTSAVQDVLARLHEDAKGDRGAIEKNIPTDGSHKKGELTPEMAKDAYLPVSAIKGRALNVVARTAGAKNMVEFGTSFGISTIYLAAAASDNGGHVMTSELQANKCEVATKNIAEAGLADVVTVLEGDATETLAGVPDGIDLLFLDGWKDLYIPVLDLLTPKMRVGSIVMGDNITMADTQPFYNKISAPDSGFVTCLLDEDTSLSYYLGR